MNVIFACGGTGGHIYPALAVAKYIRENAPDWKILFVGGEDSMEEELVPREGFEIRLVPAHAFNRGLNPADMVRNIRTAFGQRKYARLARKILQDFRPDVVVGTGGYSSFSAVRGAQKLGIPTIIHEANAVPGLTTKMLMKHATRVLVNFEGTEQAYPNPEKVKTVGMPIQMDFLRLKREQCREELKLSPDEKLVVSFMGSQGAREMNKKVAEMISLLASDPKFHLIHACGSYGWKWMPDLICENGVDLEKTPWIDVREYIHDMPRLLSAADLVVCRAGASTLSEIRVSGVPALLVPSPNVANNHQEMNARVLERNGGAKVLLEDEINGTMLFEQIESLLEDSEKLEQMRTAQKNGAISDSTERIYRTILEVAES